MFIAQSATTTTLDELILGCRCIAPLGQTHFAEYIFPFVDASAIHDTKHNIVSIARYVQQLSQQKQYFMRTFAAKS